MVDHVLLPFAGPGEGIGELSWGQRSMWTTIQREGQSIMLGGPAPQPPGTTLDELKKRYIFMISRHPALRTRLVFDPDGSVRQRVFGSGTYELAVLDAGDRDPAEVAQEVYADYTGRDFDYADEWPVRLAVVCQQGVPRYTVGVFLHLQVDGLGLQTLVRDFANMDRRTGQPLRPAEGWGPLEQARWQSTPAAQRQSEASLRHLDKVLRSVPLERFPLKYPEAEPEFPMLTVRSRTLLLATRLLSRQLNIDDSPILLGLYAVALGRLRQQGRFVTLLAVSNRFRPGLAQSVSGVAQVSPCLFEVADISLAEALTRARRGSMSAYKYGYYDPVARQQLIDGIIAERGARADLSCFFNDRRAVRNTVGPFDPTPDDLIAALPETTMSWSPVEELTEKLYLSVSDAVDAIGLELSAGRQYFSQADAEELVRSMETIAIEAAIDPTANTGVGLVPVPA
ncbi:MAG TPA: condensation domain-containing protein [Jatrophihabitans sp.]|nr:condensation domain-containing protein [Jatrophihabitans sp.]